MSNFRYKYLNYVVTNPDDPTFASQLAFKLDSSGIRGLRWFVCARVRLLDYPEPPRCACPRPRRDPRMNAKEPPSRSRSQSIRFHGLLMCSHSSSSPYISIENARKPIDWSNFALVFHFFFRPSGFINRALLSRLLLLY